MPAKEFMALAQGETGLLEQRLERDGTAAREPVGALAIERYVATDDQPRGESAARREGYQSEARTGAQHAAHLGKGLRYLSIGEEIKEIAAEYTVKGRVSIGEGKR